MTNETLLQINDLVVSFETPQGELTAVKGVSLSLAKGETLALVGESGCGKTVLCKSMLKILCQRGRIRGGEILLTEREHGPAVERALLHSEKDLVPAAEREMERYRGKEIAMVFQDPMTSLDPAFCVGEQIAEVLRLHKGLSKADAKAQAVGLMELVRIPDAAQRYGQRPYQFSGGMRQRIAIAIALAGDPALLLADEPTTALDEETQEEILWLLKEVQRKLGTAILFITHDLSLVEEMADRVAIMKDGKLVEEGSVSDVFAAPEHAYTRQLLGYLDYRKGHGHHHRGAAGPSGQPMLSVRNLRKGFPMGKRRMRHVLEDFSMDIYRGEIVGLVGKSGCGKSTLARCVMGVEPYDDGIITLAEGVKSQMIFQDSQDAFNDRMTVEEIIAEPLLIRGGAGRERIRRGILSRDDRRAAVLTVMEAVELDANLAGRKPYELSGGQRQRVAIARALITEPDLIIADEPLTGLDVSAQAQVVHLFKKLATDKNLTILFIAHDLPMVNHISDRVIRM